MSLGILVAAAARLLDAAAVDGHDDHGHGGEDAEHDGAVVQMITTLYLEAYHYIYLMMTR